MSVIGGQNILVTNGLVYALDFKNNKSYVSGSNIAKSLIYDISTTIISGSSSFDSANQNLNIPDALNPRSAYYSDNDFYIQRNSTFTFQATSSFTIVSNLNVQSSGVLLFQNTDASKFAAHIGTSSLEIGFYNPSTEYYYTRQYNVNLRTGSVNLIYRYDNGTSDLFINGYPVTSSRSDVPPRSLQNTYYSSRVLSHHISSSFNIGIRSRLVDTYRPEFILAPYGGSLTNLYIYGRALSTNEIYSTYIQLQPAVFRNASLIKPYTLDENTLMYVSASQVTSSAYITAIDNFVTGLKSAGLWNKLSAIYPVIGSTTSSQALNLKEPVINRLVYSGSWIASPSGSYPSSSTSYVQLSGFDYPAILTSSAHITYLSYDLPQATASLVAVDKPLSAVGGEIFYSGSKTYHVFRPTGTSSFTVVSPSLTSVEVLVVAGGGGSPASGYNIGGCGAGGLVYSSSVSITTGSYNVIVGEGGIKGNGQNSSFLTVTSYGGGGGSTSNGGSGAGAGATFNTTGSGGTASYGNQGNNGGDSVEIYTWGAAGGGGHGSKGETAGVTKTRYASGGSGSYFAQYAGIGLGSPAGWFAGGGGSGGGLALPGNNTTRGPGGIGGGGSGAIESDYGLYNSPPFSGPGIPTASKNTGGGAGGAWYNTGIYGAGNGGSGIVIVSYNTNQSTFTSSFGISITDTNIVGNLHSTTTSGLTGGGNVGLITVSRTGSSTLSIHKNTTSSIFIAPVTASILGSVYGNASNYAGVPSNFATTTISYLSYGAGLSPLEVTAYHTLVQQLQNTLRAGNLLLDQYPSASAAYSLRKLYNPYFGPAIRVRRDSDNTLRDIGFTSDGQLDTVGLLDFVGVTGSGFVNTWYDQSGNSYDLTQGTTTSQPLILVSGSVYTDTNKPAVYFDGGDSLVSPSTTQTMDYLSAYILARPLTDPAFGYGWWRIGTTNQSGYKTFLGYNNDINTFYYSKGGDTSYTLNFIIAGKKQLLTVDADSTGFNFYDNNTLSQTLTRSGILSGGTQIRLGTSIYGTSPVIFQENIIYPESKRNTILSDVNNNILSAYTTGSDPDYQAFITATGITQPTQSAALETLVSDLKSYGLWNKMKAIYPMITDRQNLLEYSQTLTSGSWLSGLATVTANTVTAPDGTLTGNTISTTDLFHYVQQAITGSHGDQTVTFSWYARSGSLTDVKYSVYDITNLTNIVAPTSYMSQISSGNWTRVSASFTVPTTSTRFAVYPLRDSQATGSVYVWGLQVEVGSTASAYVPTTTNSGSTAAMLNQMKYNLKDPRDTDSAFRLTYSGSWNPGYGGAKSDGVTAYADTKLTPSQMNQNSIHFGYYNRTYNTAGIKMGVFLAADNSRSSVIYGNGSSAGCPINSSFAPSQQQDAVGHVVVSRINSTQRTVFNRGVADTVSSTSNGTISTHNFYIGAPNLDGTPWAGNFANTAFTFSTIGDGLTNYEGKALYWIIQKYQTTLGRQVY